MAKWCRLSRALPLGVAALVAYPFAALSQTVAPSQVTPQTLRPAAPSPPGGLDLSGGARLQAPAGTAALSFIVGRLRIEGAFPELESETRSLARAIEGHRVTVAQIYEFANALEQAYARAGYVLVRVTVPPQKLNDRGPLRIVVVDGFIEKVQVDNVPDRVRVLVASRMASLVGRRHIKLDEIERPLLIAGDVPGLRLKSTLARGKALGGALLVLEGTHQLVSATASIDNHLPASLGTWSYGANVALNSAFGLGEQFYASAQSSGDLKRIFDSSSPLRVFGAGAVLPLGLDGWILNPEYTNSRSLPEPVIGGLASVGQFERFALRTSYPLDPHAKADLHSDRGLRIYQPECCPAALCDRPQPGPLRRAAHRRGLSRPGCPGGDAVLQSSATLSQGTGGRDRADAAASGIPLSRQGAGPIFTKANVDAHLTQPLPAAFRIDLIGRGQTSFGKPMLVSEQFSLDGPQAISAYPSGTLNVDEGGTLRGELSRSFHRAQLPRPPKPVAIRFRRLRRRSPDRSDHRRGCLGPRRGRRRRPAQRHRHSGRISGRKPSASKWRGNISNLPNLTQVWRGNFSMSIRF